MKKHLIALAAFCACLVTGPAAFAQDETEKAVEKYRQMLKEDPWSNPGLLDADPHQLIDSRVIVETGALPHVARSMARDPGIETGLRELAERFRSARDLKCWIDLDVRFHRTLLEASGLKPLIAFGDLLTVFFQRFRESVKRAEWRLGIESHRRLVDLLAAGRVAEAAADLRNHIESHKERLQ